MGFRAAASGETINWLGVVNASGFAVPPFGLAQVDGLDNLGNVRVITPAGAGGEVLVNSDRSIPYTADASGTPDGQGQMHAAPGPNVCTVAYDTDDGTPAQGELWGPLSGFFKLKKGVPGFVVVGPIDTGLGLAQVIRQYGDGYQIVTLAAGGNTFALKPGVTNVLVYAPQPCSTLTNLTGGAPGRTLRLVNVAGGTSNPFTLGAGFQTNVASGAYQVLGPGEGMAFVGAAPPSRPWTSAAVAAHAALTRTNLPVAAPSVGALAVHRKQNVYCLDGGDYPLVDRTQSDCATNPNVGDLLYVYNDRGGPGEVTILHDGTFTDASGGVARFFLPRGQDMRLNELEGAIFIYGPLFPGASSSSSGSGSSGGGGGGYCFSGNCGDPGVPPTLTAVISHKVGCWTTAPDTVTFNCTNDADPPDGFHGYQTSTSISACGSLASWSINGDPAVYLSAGASFAHAQPGYTCSPFHAVFLIDDGAGNSATITVDE